MITETGYQRMDCRFTTEYAYPVKTIDTSITNIKSMRKKDIAIWNKVINWIVDDEILNKNDGSWEFEYGMYGYDIDFIANIRETKVKVRLSFGHDDFNLVFMGDGMGQWSMDNMRVDFHTAPTELKDNLIRLNDYIADKKHILAHNDKEYNSSFSFDIKNLSL